MGARAASLAGSPSGTSMASLLTARPIPGRLEITSPHEGAPEAPDEGWPTPRGAVAASEDDVSCRACKGAASVWPMTSGLQRPRLGGATRLLQIHVRRGPVLDQ
jgi:hypothetical protein